MTRVTIAIMRRRYLDGREETLFEFDLIVIFFLIVKDTADYNPSHQLILMKFFN